MQRTKPVLKRSRQPTTIPIHYPASTYRQPWPSAETTSLRKTTSVSFANTKPCVQDNSPLQGIPDKEYTDKISCHARKQFYKEHQKSILPKTEAMRRLLSEIPSEASHLKYGVFNNNRRKRSDILISSPGQNNLNPVRKPFTPALKTRVQSVGIMTMAPQVKKKAFPKKKSLADFNSNVQDPNKLANKRRTVRKGQSKLAVNSNLVRVSYKKNPKKCIHCLSISQTMHIDIKPKLPNRARKKSPDCKNYCVPITQLPCFDCFLHPDFLSKASLSSARNDSPTRRSLHSVSVNSSRRLH